MSEIKVYGWCLMGNHVHLLLKEGREDISTTMKRIGVSYVGYYNWKYKTTGHLFQDRFKSEVVESDEYLLIVLRYIHQNPVKAGLVKKPDEWKWSSCLGYYGKKDTCLTLLDLSFILEMFAKDLNASILRFKEFNGAENNDQCLDEEVTERIRLSDEEARREILKLISGIEITQVKSLPKNERDKVLQDIKRIEGVTQRQAARILGISPNLIFKA